MTLLCLLSAYYIPTTIFLPSFICRGAVVSEIHDSTGHSTTIQCDIDLSSNFAVFLHEHALFFVVVCKYIVYQQIMT